MINLQADCCKLIAASFCWKQCPFLQRHAYGRQRHCSMKGSAPPVNNNAARVAAADAGSSALQQRQLQLLQLPCPWPAQACSSSCNYLSTAAAPLGEEVAQAKHGGGGKVWGINPCSSAQLAFMLSSRPAGQQDYMELNSESAGISPVMV